VVTIKSSVLLKFNRLSITIIIIKFGGLFALKVGHHHRSSSSKQDHQAANRRLFSMHPRGGYIYRRARAIHPHSTFCARGNRSEIEFGPCASQAHPIFAPQIN
jgi:hypothetical protein